MAPGATGVRVGGRRVGGWHPNGAVGGPSGIAGEHVQPPAGREHGDAGVVGGARGAARPVVLGPVGSGRHPDAVGTVDDPQVPGVGVDDLDRSEGQPAAGCEGGQVRRSGRVAADDEQAYGHGPGA